MRKLILLTVFVTILCLTSCKKKEVEIVFDTRGGQPIETITDEKDFDVNNLPVPIKEGNTFSGWFLDPEVKTPIINNIPKVLKFTLYAKWQVNQYTIIYHSNGGTDVPTGTFYYGSEINAPAAAPRTLPDTNMKGIRCLNEARLPCF
jgi:uncharacterized repeat protein (TIGR02543 family)